MQFWFSRGSEVPIKDQLATQIMLGILCGDLLPGERLPSTRELARRFRIHPNTVSAGYRSLERDQWVQARHGSGVYVRPSRPAISRSADLALDQMIADLFRSARTAGVSLPTLRGRLRHWLAAQPPDHFVLIEPDESLREIVITEMRQAITVPMEGCGLAECRLASAGAVAVVLPSKAEAVRQLLPPETDLITLQVRSIHSTLAKYLPAPADSLIGIASRWPAFLDLAHTMMIAAGFHADSLILRRTTQPGWRNGLSQSTAIICDSVTAEELSGGLRGAAKKMTGPRVIPFSLLAESSLEELRSCEELILRSHLPVPAAASATHSD